MSYLMLIAGLVLLFAGSSWFTGATAVGVILTIAGGFWVLIGLVVVIAALLTKPRSW